MIRVTLAFASFGCSFAAAKEAVMKRARRSADLFGKKPAPAFTCGVDAEQLSRRLRTLSEDAYRFRMNRAAILIEVAAQIVEMEGRAIEEADDESFPG